MGTSAIRCPPGLSILWISLRAFWSFWMCSRTDSATTVSYDWLGKSSFSAFIFMMSFLRGWMSILVVAGISLSNVPSPVPMSSVQPFMYFRALSRNAIRDRLDGVSSPALHLVGLMAVAMSFIFRIGSPVSCGCS